MVSRYNIQWSRVSSEANRCPSRADRTLNSYERSLSPALDVGDACAAWGRMPEVFVWGAGATFNGAEHRRM